MFENPRRGREARNFTTNVPKILDLKSSSEQIFSENCRWVPLFRLRETLTEILLEVACEQALEETRKAFPWAFSFFLSCPYNLSVTVCNLFTHETRRRSYELV